MKEDLSAPRQRQIIRGEEHPIEADRAGTESSASTSIIAPHLGTDYKLFRAVVNIMINNEFHNEYKLKQEIDGYLPE